MEPRIAPSVLAADFYELRPQLEAVKSAGVTVLHVDVMDGLFVPNISIGIPVVASLAKRSGLTLDVHLMINDPKRYIKQFAKAGADWLTVHLEAVPDGEVCALLTDIRGMGLKAGLSIKPDTAVSALEPYVKLCDLILMMTVPPGFGGQSYDPNGDARIAEARALIDDLRPECILSVDGGIDESTIGGAYNAGARLLVAGSSVFGKPDAAQAVRGLLGCMGG